MIKKLLYGIYAILFNISRLLFRIKENRIVFVSMHNENFNDSLGAVKKEIEKTGEFETVFITRRDLDVKLSNVPRVFEFFFVKSRKLATAKYVFLNDNFMPMAKLNFRDEAVITQLWHAEGVFKKFGLAINQPDDVRKNEIGGNSKLTYVVCSSESVVPYYAEAFGVDEKKVLPLGAPRVDFLLSENNSDKARENLEKQFPSIKNKKLVLYAPTFRNDRQANEDILTHFEIDRFNEELGNEYALLVRFHPQIHPDIKALKGAVNVTDYNNVCELVSACDVLVTDYSSICMDFSLLSKKTVFFAYDLESYDRERSFYFDYESYVPGEVARTTDEVIEAIKKDFDSEKNERFRSFNFDYIDCNNAKRIKEKIIGG